MDDTAEVANGILRRIDDLIRLIASCQIEIDINMRLHRGQDEKDA